MDEMNIVDSLEQTKKESDSKEHGHHRHHGHHGHHSGRKQPP